MRYKIKGRKKKNMLFTMYKDIIIMYQSYQKPLLNNLLKIHSKDLQALKKALKDNSIEAY